MTDWAAEILAREERFRSGLDAWLTKHWDEAEHEAMQPAYETPQTYRLDIGGYVTAEIVTEGPEALLCTHWDEGPGLKGHSRRRDYIRCHRGAGQGTDHAGVGLCWMHDGHRGRGKVQGAILMGHAFGDELNVSPWEALLQQVRLLANQVAWAQLRVNQAEATGGDAAIRPGGEGWDWVVLLEARGDRLARVSKMAIDAGVAQQLVRQIELEADYMYKAASAMLDSLGLSDTARELALSVLSTRLLELEAGENG